MQINYHCETFPATETSRSLIEGGKEMALVSIKEMFNKALSAMIARIGPVLIVRLIVVLASLAVSWWGAQGLLESLQAFAPEGIPLNSQNFGEILGSLPREQLIEIILSARFWLSILVNLVIFLWGQGAMYLVLYPNAKLGGGEPRPLAAIALGALGLIIPLVVVNIFYGVLVFIGLILLIIPGLWLAVKYSFTPLVVAIDEQSAFSAFTRSSELVKGFWWGIFGRLLLVGLVAIVGSYLVGLIPIIGRYISGLIFPPFVVACQIVIWDSLKGIKQGSSSQTA